jgi:cell division transport system permease protein
VPDNGSGIMKNWLRQHGYAIAEAWRHIRKPRGGFLLNALVIAVVLALPFGGFVLFDNLQSVSGKLAVEPELSLYLSPSASRKEAEALVKPLKQLLDEAHVSGKIEFIPREKALAELGGKNGLSAAMAALNSNPLPDAYLIRLRAYRSADEAAGLEALAARLQALPEVEHVQVDSAWIKRLAALMHVFRLALLFLAAVLGVVVTAVVFNTVRLQVLNQREEIAVCKLVGATDGFVHRPFYYAGVFLGVLAGGLALGLVVLAMQPMNQALSEVARLYGTEFQLGLPSPAQWTAFFAGSAALGWLGAFLSVRRTLLRLQY